MHEIVDEHMIERILAGNEELAQHNREHLDEDGLFAINLMSAPGAGKTSLLSATIQAMKNVATASVIEGDMVGDLDAQRLKSVATKVLQISTGRSCHLDARMVARLLHVEELSGVDFLFIENVGNLVCPAEFPLGEHKRVVLLSITEGDDKPIKYPIIFRNCDAVVFTKCDLLPYVSFDIASAQRHVRDLNPDARFFEVSVVTGEGLANWISWLTAELKTHRAARGGGLNVPVSAG